MIVQVNLVQFYNQLPNSAQDGDTYYVDESSNYFTQPIYYVWKNGAWEIEYV